MEVVRGVALRSGRPTTASGPPHVTRCILLPRAPMHTPQPPSAPSCQNPHPHSKGMKERVGGLCCARWSPHPHTTNIYKAFSHHIQIALQNKNLTEWARLFQARVPFLPYETNPLLQLVRSMSRVAVSYTSVTALCHVMSWYARAIVRWSARRRPSVERPAGTHPHTPMRRDPGEEGCGTMHGADERAPGPSKVTDRQVSRRSETPTPLKGPGISGASGVHL